MFTDRELAMDYDPYAPEVREDPFPLYARMQEQRPVHYLRGLDLYTLTRFDDIITVLQHPERFSNRQGPGWQRLPREAVEAGGVLGLADPPAHGRQRKLVNRAFTPRGMQGLETRVEEISRTLIADGCTLASSTQFQHVPAKVIVRKLRAACWIILRTHRCTSDEHKASCRKIPCEIDAIKPGLNDHAGFCQGRHFPP